MHRISLGNESVKLELSQLGARITSIKYKQDNQWIELHEYYPTDEPYLSKRKYTGATVGPVAGRITAGSLVHKKQQFQLIQNEGPNTLHSGSQGLHSVNWKSTQIRQNQIVFACTRNQTDDGFPGERTFQVMYTLDGSSIDIKYKVRTSRTCPINLTNHAYFNLNGNQELSQHQFMIKASHFVTLNSEKIPTGKLEEVAGTDMDLNTMQYLNGRVFDHCFVLGKENDMVASAIGLKTGIRLDVLTDQPGVQFYSGNKKYFCFETQHFPDSMNHPHFPSTLLEPEDEYSYHCSYRFSSIEP